MLDPQTFDPRDAYCKTPFGAAPSGTVVALTLRPLRSMGFSRAVLTARFESRPEDEVEHIFMPWTDTVEDRDLFRAALPTGDYVGLIWYTFRLERIDGKTLESQEFQLTVYDEGAPVPSWFGEGFTYQIFPDRFRRTHIPDSNGLVGNRQIHQDWLEDPVYRPDEQGEIRNRDFFGGNFAGILEKLPYLKSLGVETLYFNPIFEGPENHRYGTADYEHIDPMLGSNEAFSLFCNKAHSMGMRVMLDGVFNHTGFVSKYFDGDGFYREHGSMGPLGAAQSRESPYYPWFSFQHWPDKYDAWWGIYSLPAINESNDDYLNYIIRNEDSIVRRWLRAGADGWRLDVADELPDSFIHALHQAVRTEKSDGVVIGEVWEDGSTKVAYGVRRKHILGGHCDGLMNYPFRNALIAYLQGGGAEVFMAEMETLRENYPPFAYYSAMNALGTHDTPRILTLLGKGTACLDQSRDWRAAHRLAEEELARGLALLRLGAMVLFSFPGSPTVYYGDEAGMEGFEDPFNRRCFPWGGENRPLTAWFAALGNLRRTYPALRRGDITYLKAEGPVLAFTRSLGEETVLCAVNAGSEPAVLEIPWSAVDLLQEGAYAYDFDEACALVPLPPMEGKLLQRVDYLSGA